MLPNRCPGIRLLADTGYREITNDTGDAYRPPLRLFFPGRPLSLSLEHAALTNCQRLLLKLIDIFIFQLFTILNKLVSI